MLNNFKMPSGDQNSQDSKHQESTNHPQSSVNFAGNTFSPFNETKYHYITNDTSSWIIDSGASDHMCFDKSLLFQIHKLHIPHHITLPNGEKTISFEVGSTRITKEVVLHNVLYVPMFRYNLLSIGKICKDLKSFIMFSEHYCFLLHGGLSLKRPLVLGKHHVGLYFLHSKQEANKSRVMSVSTKTSLDSFVIFSNSLCNSVSNDTNASLWHKRLGHLPMYKIKTLNVLNKENVDLDFVCEICPKA